MIGLLSRFQTTLIFAAIVVALIGGAYLKGRHDSSASWRAKIELATAKQLEERGRIDEDVSKLTDCQLLRELGGVSDDCE